MIPHLAMIMGFQLAGELLVRKLAVPFPGPLCGMLLLLGWLQLKGGPCDGLKTASGMLVGNLGLLFAPAGTAVLGLSVLLAKDLPAILVAIVVPTLVAIAVAGRVAAAYGRSAGSTLDQEI